MTVNSIYNSSIKLLGYNNLYLSLEDNDILKKRAVEFVNRIGADLFKMPPTDDFLEEFNVPEGCLEALIYGVCMLLSLSEGDGDKNRLFCELYNSKRAEAKAKVSKIKDVFPTGFEV